MYEIKNESPPQSLPPYTTTTTPITPPPRAQNCVQWKPRSLRQQVPRPRQEGYSKTRFLLHFNPTQPVLWCRVLSPREPKDNAKETDNLLHPSSPGPSKSTLNMFFFQDINSAHNWARRIWELRLIRALAETRGISSVSHLQ